MEQTFVNQMSFYAKSRPLWIGVGFGVILTIISSFIRPITLFRFANDPLQLVQPIIQLRFGLINFNWRLPLIHLGFMVTVALLTPLLLKLIWDKGLNEENAVLMARAAAITSIAYMWWLRVDAIPVLIW